jgi:cytochrome c oxidase cbb3-type subunit 1
VNPDGTLTYTFAEGVKATFPYYVIRVSGGALYLSGMLVMAWNTFKTMAGTRSMDMPIPALAPHEHKAAGSPVAAHA